MEENKHEGISKISNNIKNILNESNSTEVVEDLIENYEKTIENTSHLINNLIQSIDKIIKDEEIKYETKELINEIKKDFKNKIDLNFNYLLSDSLNKKNFEEE